MKPLKEQKREKGQSTVEYILLAAAVIAVLVFFLRPDGPFAGAYNSALDDATGSMNVMSGRLADTYADTNGTTSGGSTSGGDTTGPS
jgi:hypothetical protein